MVGSPRRAEGGDEGILWRLSLELRQGFRPLSTLQVAVAAVMPTMRGKISVVGLLFDPVCVVDGGTYFEIKRC